MGGGIAVNANGFPRSTLDVDVFARPTTARALARALADAGLTVETVAPSHMIAYFPGDNPRADVTGLPPHRVDILATVTEPEVSAIRTAVLTNHAGLMLPLMQRDVLVAIKFMAGRPRDLGDAGELILDGRVNIEKARYLIAVSDGDRAARRFDAFVARTKRPRPNPGGYVQRHEEHLAVRRPAFPRLHPRTR